MIGLNEGNFPSHRGDFEEETRLAYVAMTRAKERLIMSSYNRTKNYKGEEVSVGPSIFLNYIS